MKRNCPICNEEYTKSHNRQIYCSKECFDKYRQQYKKEYQKKYYKIYKKILLDKMKIYRKSHKSKIKKLNENYRQIHREEKNDYLKNRRRIDINFKLACYLRSRLWLALKGSPKLLTTMKLVGCTIEQLKNHLEKQFKPNMSWNNWSRYGWHIDHIRPCASFDLSKSKEQRKCFNYTNLQPLWAKDNLSKKDNRKK